MSIILNLTWATVLLPLVGVGIAFLAESPRRAAQAGMAVTALAFGTAVVVLVFRLTHIIPAYENVQTFWDLQVTPPTSGGPLLPTGFLLTWGIRVDPLSVAFMTSVLFLSLAAQVHAFISARAEEGFRRFFWVANVLTFGMLAMISSPTLFQFFLGWEIVGVTAWFLATHVWQRAAVAAAATRTFVLLRVGDLALLLALALTYSRFGVAAGQTPATNGLSANDPFNFAVLAPLWHAAHAGTILGVGTRSLVVLAVLFVVAAVIHAAVGPLHLWLSGAAQAPVAGLALLAMAAPVGSAVLLARVYPELVEAPHVLTALALVGAAGAVAAALLALAQTDLFRVGIFAVSSQAGLVLAAFGMGGYSPALFAVFTLSALAVLYFLCAGNIARRYRSREIVDHGGAWRLMPRTSLGLLVWALGVSGLSLNTYSALSATLRNVSPTGGTAAALVVVLVAVAVVVVMVTTALYAFRVFFLVTGGEPARRRGFDSARIREVETPMVRSVLAAAAAAVVCTIVGIPGVNSFMIGSRTIPGLTFSHFVYYGNVRQVLAVDGYALVAACVLGAGGAAAAWYLYSAPRLSASRALRARVVAVGGGVVAGTLTERAVAHVPAGFLAAGAVLDRLDEQLLTPVVDAVGETTGALADLLTRLRTGRLGVSLAASAAVVALLLAASILAVTGHFIVDTR